MKIYPLLIAFAVLAYVAVFGHSKESHRNDENTESHRIATDTVSIANDSTRHQHSELENMNKENIVSSESMFEHLHNKIIHFPIALSIMAFFLSILNFKAKKYDQSILLLVVVAFVTSIAAVITGLIQESHFEGEPKEWILDIHKGIGFIIAIFLLLWTIALRIPAMKKYHWIAGLIVVVLVSVTGFLGGLISH